VVQKRIQHTHDGQQPHQEKKKKTRETRETITAIP
jgi:hypothetical protein